MFTPIKEPDVMIRHKLWIISTNKVKITVMYNLRYYRYSSHETAFMEVRIPAKNMCEYVIEDQKIYKNINDVTGSHRIELMHRRGKQWEVNREIQLYHPPVESQLLEGGEVYAVGRGRQVRAISSPKLITNLIFREHFDETQEEIE